ncbi:MULTISPECIES: glutathione synthase [unclassified Mycobacterium]|uniref:glutathione synthase n=1 Tax=unclassified Mycobacterium TaxID=2642494 RepID=UPI0029C881AC|nr:MULTISPECIES: glutathione synthase [unclassified Mycobacterium]
MKTVSLIDPTRSATAGSGLDFVFIVDPLNSLQPAHDSSVALMEAAQAAGHGVLVTETSQLALIDGKAVARCRDARLRPAVLNDGRWLADTDWYTVSAARMIVLDDVAAVFMRTDPPVDANYLRATFVLDLVDPARTLLVNSPAGLRDANEKIFALRVPEMCPATLLSACREDIIDTVNRWGTAVLKPTDGMGGRGILLLRAQDPNLRSILDTATQRGREHVIVQQYMSAVSEEGDRRVILLNGEPLGVIRRIASGDEFRCNMATGAQVHADRVTERDHEICRALAPELLSRGLHFAGIDIIAGMLTEVNVTSPTGIREIDALCGTHLGGDIIDWTVARCTNGAPIR